jgi:hypothetical protein
MEIFNFLSLSNNHPKPGVYIVWIFLSIVSLATLIISFFTIFIHFLSFKNKWTQLKFMVIILIGPVYTINSLISLFTHDYAPYSILVKKVYTL